MTRTLMVTLLAASVSGAAPVPKGPPPPNPKTSANLALGTAKMAGNGQIEFQSVQMSYRAVPVTETVTVNGQQVTVTRTVAQPQATTTTYRLAVAGTKATGADGKEIDADELARRLGDGGAAVRVVGTMDPEWRKLFADDVVFLEASGVSTLPAAGVNIRPGVIQALPIRPAIAPPLPVAPPPPPPAEKKEDKKDEKKK